MTEIVGNPYTLFAEWYNQAQELGLHNHNAMTLATADAVGRPSARIVLLRGFDERGFVFFTNYTSRKSREINENPRAALCIYWEGVCKQINIEGKVEQVSPKESDNYFAHRPRESQLGAWASKQSQPMHDPHDLQRRVDEVTTSFEGDEVPRPPFWGGFRVIPHTIEFWQQGQHRLHTRIRYTDVGGKWETEQLYP